MTRPYEELISEPQIVYELPLNKVTQAMKNNKNITTSWEVIREFLQNCTNAEIFCPDEIKIEIWHKPSMTDTAQIQDFLTEKLGKPKTHWDGLYSHIFWKLEASQLENALQLMREIKPLPSFLELGITYSFDFVDRESQKILDCGKRKSFFVAFLGKNSKIMPQFWFPFDNIKDLQDYLSKINDFLPFKKLDEKAFRMVKLNKKGTGNVIRKIKTAL